jgi:hypothetical protein
MAHVLIAEKIPCARGYSLLFRCECGFELSIFGWTTFRKFSRLKREQILLTVRIRQEQHVADKLFGGSWERQEAGVPIPMKVKMPRLLMNRNRSDFSG